MRSILVAPDPSDPWYATFHYTHPPIPDRIRYIERLSEEDVDGSPALD